MVEDSQKVFNRIHLFVDAIIIAFSYACAYYLKFKLSFANISIGRLPMQTYFFALVFILPGYLLLYYAFDLYDNHSNIRGRRQEFANILKANIVGILVFIVVLYGIRQLDFSRYMLVQFFCFNVFLDTFARNVFREVLKKMRRDGKNIKYILLIGYSRAAEEYIDRIQANPQWGYIIRGVLDDDIESGLVYKGIKVLGRIDNLVYILKSNSAHLNEIAITLSIKQYDKLESIVAMCEKSGLHTKFIPDYNKIIPTKPYTEDLLGLPVINIRHIPLSIGFNQFIKRVMDIVGALASLIVFSPVMLITAILIKTTSKGPLIYKQERVGLRNRPFKMYKFRSMEVQPEKEEKKAWTVKNDPRVTPIGKFIRKTSIDELPQIINVLKGEMSLVGPRPERPLFVEKFREEIPRYMIKHQVRPGMTGWAQVNGFRGDTSIIKRIEHDLYYIENWTLGLDFKILFLTIFKGFVNKNAY
ncbi:Undecaprenyl-phosphate glucose phosphotransferase [Acetitomaculum ruminis DSM 5522]|uniref:Undecaprenyl-phosphate glucose phosphotransferase n=1 Tax=Acetitomaculum ruminis DSM 5522 TaxID=1120918 RepID=A0A1I0YLA1_9FIRM|nr:Undecaprenyl-phosphate glucose phosphotransferase [Acetitomaculum ruminis DSM 5522]